MEKVILHEREADGVKVELFVTFSRVNGETETHDVTVHVHDSRNGEDFTISDIPPFRALEVFYHPFSVGKSLLTRGGF